MAKSDLCFCERILDYMEKQDNSFYKTMKGLPQIFTHIIANAYQMILQIFTSSHSASVHSYSQPVFKMQYYQAFPNYWMDDAPNTHLVSLLQSPQSFSSRYDEACSSTGDGADGGN